MATTFTATAPVAQAERYAGPFSDAAQFSAADAGPQLGAGRSLIVVFAPTTLAPLNDAVALGYAYGAHFAGGSQGWTLNVRANGIVDLLYRPNAITSVGYVRPLPGAPARLALNHRASGIYAASNGGPRYALTSSVPSYVTAATAGKLFTLGGGGGWASAGTALTQAGIKALVVLARDLTDDELLAASDPDVEGWAIALRTDPAVVAAFDASTGFAAGKTLVVTGSSGATLASGSAVARPAVVPQYTRVALLGTPAPWDSGAVVVEGAGAWERCDPLASYVVDTDAETVLPDYRATLDPTTQQAQASVARDGTVVASPQVLVPNAADPRAMVAALGSGGTTKRVAITVGLQSKPPGATGPLGTFASAIWIPRGRTLTRVAPATTARRLVIGGDSIAVGDHAANAAQGAFAARARATYPGRITVYGYGYGGVWDYATGSGGLDALADALAARLDGTTTNELWLEWSTNDFGLARYASVATFQTDYTSLLTKLRARTAARIFAQTAIVRTDAAGLGTNANGQTLAQFRTAVASAVTAAAISNCTLVDGTTLMSSGDLHSDGVHPTDAGHQAIYLAQRSVVGW